jgi:multiple sugar transport system ATP-binding protein
MLFIMADVLLDNLTKRFDQTTVLSALNLHVKDGEFLVLVGPSGCGKSTVLRLIAGLEAPTDGHIAIEGRPVNSVPPKDRDIAMVFQNYALYPHMTVYDNLAFGLKMRKTPKAQIAEKVATVAESLGLTPLLQRKPKQLSGGQRQRVALGRAIVRNPKVFLMDEPLSNLDARLRVSMRAELAALHQRLGTTTLYVTHDQTEAMTLGQRIVVLNGGQVQQADTPLAVYSRPANTFVANFLGHMNMFQVTVDGSQFRLKDGTAWPIPDVLQAGLAPHHGQTVQLGLRPEQFSTTQGTVQVAVSPERTELLGHEKHLHFTLLGEACLARVSPYWVGQSLWVDLHGVSVFDCHTGNRLAEASA